MHPDSASRRRRERIRYDRIGYKVVRIGSTDEFYPNLSPLLATPCDFVIYRKDIQRE
jgi:hypothetical protein